MSYLPYTGNTIFIRIREYQFEIYSMIKDYCSEIVVSSYIVYSQLNYIKQSYSYLCKI